MKSSSTEMPRVIVIGLDSATNDLMIPWMEQGLLPTMQHLRSEGVWGDLRSVMTVSTAPAWASFATGKNPGKTGMFEFMQLRKDTYELVPLDGRAILAKKFWDYAGEAGLKTILLNYPTCYPPERINGYLTTGLVTPHDAAQVSYPPELFLELRRAVGDYRINPRESFSRTRADDFIHDLNSVVDGKIRAALYMIKKYEWDIFVQVFNETDMIQHGFWYCLDKEHPHYLREHAEKYGDAVLRLYQKIDAFLSELLPLLDGRCTLLIVSDHGAGALKKHVHNNNWLLRTGLLQRKSSLASMFKYGLFRLGMTPTNVYGLASRLGFGRVKSQLKGTRKTYNLVNRLFFSFSDLDWTRSAAYSVGGGLAGYIYVNLKGRESQGTVAPGEEYERLLDRVIFELRNLQDPETGEHIIGDIFAGRDVFTGPYADQGPDLIYFPKDPTYAIFSNFAFSSNRLMEPAPDYVTGQHRLDGMFLASGRAIREHGTVQGANLIDVAPTIHALLGLPIPGDMDGKILVNALDPEWLPTANVRYAEARSQMPQPELASSAYTTEEEEEITGRLRALGYLN